MKNNNLSISIYIISKNYDKYLEQSILSVINQTENNWNLFLINDGSTDQTKKIMLKYQQKYPKRVFFINNQETIGLQKNANNIIKISKNDLLMRLDADDWLENNALRLIINEFKKNKKIDIVYGNYYYSTSNGIRISKENKLVLNKKSNFKHFPPHGACTAFKKNVLQKNGGYNENFNAQDGWDLWHKIATKNNVSYIKNPVFNYRQHDKSISKNKLKILEARDKIFEFYSDKIKSKNKNLVAIIPVKENYESFKNVPFIKINNKNLIERAIESAENCSEIKKTILSTESEKIIYYVNQIKKKKKYKKIVTFKRKKDNQQKYINLKKIIEDACSFYKKKFRNKIDYVTYLSIHSPFRKSSDISKCFNIIKVNKCDLVFSVQTEYDPVFKFANSGLKILNPGRFDHINFEKETLLRFNGSIIVLKYKKNFNLFKGDLGYFEMSINNSYQIKTFEDFEKIKKLKLK